MIEPKGKDHPSNGPMFGLVGEATKHLGEGHELWPPFHCSSDVGVGALSRHVVSLNAKMRGVRWHIIRLWTVIAVLLLVIAGLLLSGCIDANQARRSCQRSTVMAVESAVKEVSEDHLKECEAALQEVSAACTPMPCDTEPCRCGIQFIERCDDPPPCKWDDIESGKLSKWRICAGPLAEAYAKWTKANCDPMPCHCQ